VCEEERVNECKGRGGEIKGRVNRERERLCYVLHSPMGKCRNGNLKMKGEESKGKQGKNKRLCGAV
jgi:hypothetical protein